MRVHKKCQSIRSNRLAGYGQHIHVNVLFYYLELIQRTVTGKYEEF